ncbi:unnamed protein product [Moneuplotes crassus]|uniref:Uncharacterized protein n=1 Tax=Euplotes crassus TaxID=5936 RepID=A0AAD1XWX3_EUPCR|nr:unnamed protein product [Moneuplotes crassus]
MDQQRQKLNSSSDDEKKLNLFQEEDYLGEDPFAHWHHQEIQYSDDLILFSQSIPTLSNNGYEDSLDSQNETAPLLKRTAQDDLSEFAESASKNGSKITGNSILNDESSPKEEKIRKNIEEKEANLPKDKSNNSKEYSSRPDVVAKSVIRGVKRYFCQLLCSGNSLIQSLESDNGSQSLQKVEEYCEAHFKPDCEDTHGIEILSLQEMLIKKNYHKDPKLTPEVKLYYRLKVLLASMVLYIPLNRKHCYPFVKTSFNVFYNCIYKYSKVKINKLLKFQAFRVIFEHFVAKGQMEKMIKEDPTFSCNQEVYRKTFNELLAKIRS